MLKDRLSRIFNNSKKEKDQLNANIMDGFVNIKGYKVDKDGNKKLVYHDCGDNVVTDWMRHAIMLLLTGDSFLNKGDNQDFTSGEESRNNDISITMPNIENHENKKNFDGYLLNGKQYFWEKIDYPKKYSRSAEDLEKNIYAVFPTKILFGTGKEYANWDELKSENMIANDSWYNQMLDKFSGGKTEEDARKNFDTMINPGEEKGLKCNKFSGSIAKDVFSGNGYITPMRTVNNPSVYSNTIVTTSSMNKNYGVVGAVKTPYFDRESDESMLQKNTESGTLLKPEWSGIGRPCFIYFGAPINKNEGKIEEGWEDATSDVYLSKDSSSRYLNKITFKINMPAQSAANNEVGTYYPYNGYTLRQMGLYNDSSFINSYVHNEYNDKYARSNMPCGTLLAIKNIASLDKTADIELVMTWTLTI